MEFVAQAAEGLKQIWPHLFAASYMLLMVIASAHLVLYKKDTRAAIGWIGVVIMVPVFGALLYAWLGINRVQRRAVKFRSRARQPAPRTAAQIEAIFDCLPADTRHLAALARLIARLTNRPVLPGNRVVPLVGGEQAYPQMVKAIDDAQHSVALSTYIFGNDAAGDLFVDALGRAVQRGVQVRVLIDDIGARYTFPSVMGKLNAAGVTAARFLPTLVPGYFVYSNLRSHRKILVADGQLGFTGGMNIREGHDSRFKPSHPIHDLHFRVEGPVVGQLQEVFAEDWSFATSELLDGETWFPALAAAGDVLARGIAAGPDADLDKLRLTLEGAITSAQRSCTIVTPYFLPDAPVIAALNVAALRGVQVDIILPEANNLATVKWASTAMLWQVLLRGCRVWMSPPPFDHTKLMLVDRTWTMFGSSNWDPRSLRLNFEFNVECYDGPLAEQLHALVDEKLKVSREVTLAEVDGRSLPVRLRDGVARLLTPYL